MTEKNSCSANIKILNEHGLHARPATVLVKLIKTFSSDIVVSNLDGNGDVVNGKSMMKIVSLGVKKGHLLNFTATGSDADKAIEAITQEINNGLGE